MSPNEVRLVKRAGCTPFVVFSYIKNNPERNSRMKMSAELNLSNHTIRSAVEKLKDMNVITEEVLEKAGSTNWNKRFVVKPEGEWVQ